MGQGDCEDQCDKCPDTGPVWLVGSYRLCFACREEVRYDNMKANEETKEIVSDLRVGLAATQDRENDLLTELNKLKIGIADLFELEGELDNESLLKLIKANVEYTDSMDESLTVLCGYLGARSVSIMGVFNAIERGQKTHFVLGAGLALAISVLLQLLGHLV
jgi:hypothetical protein